jgi:phosphoglycolate phosphatase
MKARRYDLIVFDWDGTISNSTGLIAECLQTAAREEGFDVPSESRAKSIIGLGIAASTETLFPTLSDAERMRVVMRFREHYVPRDHEASHILSDSWPLRPVSRVWDWIAPLVTRA